MVLETNRIDSKLQSTENRKTAKLTKATEQQNVSEVSFSLETSILPFPLPPVSLLPPTLKWEQQTTEHLKVFKLLKERATWKATGIATLHF